MTIPILKISVLRKPVIKGKMDARFPADVSVTSPIMLDRTGGNYLFGLSITDLRASLDVVYAPIGSEWNSGPFTFTSGLTVSGGALTITGGSLTNGAQALTITATQPTTPVTVQNAVSINITGAGSAAQANNAFFVSYLAGYTGSSLNRAGQFTNANLGTGSILIAAAGVNTVTGNIGVNGAATGNTTGLNNGCIGIASNGDINVGVTGISQSVKNSAKNIGVVGSAINTGTTPVQVGGWFSLNQTTTPLVSAALIADNGSQTDPIFLARDNGTTVFSIVDGGAASSTSSIKSTSSSAGIGYATGAGSTVTQGTSRTTGVTINAICGAITLVSAAGSTSIQAFTVTNSAVAATDTIIVNQKSGTDRYRIYVTAVGSGSFEISYATLSGTTSEQPVFNFAVIKAVTS